MKDVQGHSPTGSHLFPVAAVCMFVKNPPGKTEIALITQLEALLVTQSVYTENHNDGQY